MWRNNVAQLRRLNPLVHLQKCDEKTLTDLKRMNSIRDSLKELKDGQSSIGAAKRLLLVQQKRKILLDELASKQSLNLAQASQLSNDPLQSNLRNIQHKFAQNDLPSLLRFG